MQSYGAGWVGWGKTRASVAHRAARRLDELRGCRKVLVHLRCIRLFKVHVAERLGKLKPVCIQRRCSIALKQPCVRNRDRVRVVLLVQGRKVVLKDLRLRPDGADAWPDAGVHGAAAVAASWWWHRVCKRHRRLCRQQAASSPAQGGAQHVVEFPAFCSRWSSARVGEIQVREKRR